MGATPTTDNQWIDVIDGVIDAAIKGGEDAAKAYAVSQAPWLAWPVIHLVADALIGAIGKAIYSQTKALVAKVVIDVQTQYEASTAANAIREIQNAEKSGDPSAIDAADKQYDDAMARLLHWDGSSSS